MKIPSLFSKTPKYKKFNYAPRFYDADEEERREREERIKRELEEEQRRNGTVNGEAEAEDLTGAHGYQTRIRGSFKMAKRAAKVQADPSANVLRLIVLLILAIGLIAFIEYGTVALYVCAFFFVPLYFYLKFRKPRN